MTINDLQNTTQKTKNRATQNVGMNSGGTGRLMCSCSTSNSRHDTVKRREYHLQHASCWTLSIRKLNTNYIIQHEHPTKQMGEKRNRTSFLC